MRKNLTAMLKEFRVKNFLSFGKEQLFSMEAFPKSKISELQAHVVHVGDQDILKLASIYGPNGGGKTNLIRAIGTLQSVVLNRPIIAKTNSKQWTYKHAFSLNERPVFSVFFATPIGEIGYEICCDFSRQVGGDPFTLLAAPLIIKEEMVFRATHSDSWSTMFTRDESGCVTSEILSSIDIIANRRPLAPSMSFLGYIGSSLAGRTDGGDDLRPLFVLFREFQAIYTFGNYPLDGFQFPTQLDPKQDAQMKEGLRNLAAFLSSAGIPISSVYLEPVSPVAAELVFERKLPDGSVGYIPFNMESAGTKKLAAFFIQVLINGNIKIVLADDVDAAMHPSLMSALIKFFGSEQNKDRQFIFNSQDIINMTNEHFRRDEIWFAERDENYQTILHSLADIVNYAGKQVRKDAKYGKQYLEGAYGADPFLEKGLSL